MELPEPPELQELGAQALRRVRVGMRGSQGEAEAEH